MRLFCYEWKKLWLRRSLLIFIILFFILNFWKIYDIKESKSYFSDNPGWETAYWQLYDQYAGEITREKVQNLLDFYAPYRDAVQDLTYNTAIDPNSLTGINQFSDQLFLRRFYITPMQRMATYSATARSITSQAQQSIEFYRGLGNHYEMEKYARIYFLFQGRSVDDFYYFEPYARLLDCDFSSFLLLIVVIYSSALLFTREKESEMNVLIGSSPCGERRTLTAKLLVSIIFSAIVSVLFSLTDCLGFLYFYGSYRGGVLPIYALDEFIESPLRASLWQTILIFLGTRILGAITITLIYLLLAHQSKYILMAFLSGLIGALSLAGTAETMIGWHRVMFKALNPASLLFPRSLYRTTDFLNAGGTPFLTHEVAIFVSVLYSVLCLAVLYRSAFVSAVHYKGQQILEFTKSLRSKE